MLSKNLIVVGAGQLGARIAERWREAYPDADIFLKTKNRNAARENLWQDMDFKQRIYNTITRSD